MRIIQLTPGTGSFYCGSCMRDNALVLALRKQGHDALMVPLYLDPTLDEPSAAEGAPLLFGGINVYLQSKSALFRKTPRWVDRLFDAPVVRKAAAKRTGMTSAKELGEITIYSLQGEAGPQVKELDKVVEWLLENERPDVLMLSNALLLGMARTLKERTGVPVVCTLQGEDAFMDSFPEPERTQAWDLLAERARDADAFIAPSHYFGELMTRRARLDPARVHVVHNGIALDGYAPGTPSQPPVLGYLARMIPGKGMVTLIEAFILLRARNRIPDLKLRIIGSMLAADEPVVNQLRARLAEKGLADQVEFHPNVTREEKIRLLQDLSAFSVPATYGEAFGLYLIEALAAGVPVVQPRCASFPELIEATGGGLLCEPDDPAALAQAVEELLSDPQGARRMGERGRQAVVENFGVDRMAAGVQRVLEQVVSGGPVAAAAR